MDALLKQLQGLPRAFLSLTRTARFTLIAVVLAAVALVTTAALFTQGESYQYAFTNLTPEDSAEAAAALKTAQIPYRLDANGAALAVPAAKIYDARLILATAGLPRGGGVGFEIFDRGDLGVSEFTQKVNLRRALEGELARTIGKLAEVRSARVHLTLSEKGLFRDEDRKANAAVVVNLQPGRVLGDKQLAGIRHLVASAVPDVVADQVTIVDGRGTVLSAESSDGDAASGYQQKLQRDLEQRVVSLLEPVVGAGSAVVRVAAAVDASEVKSNAEVYDPDSAAVRSERKTNSTQSNESGQPGGVAGAAANQPLQNVASGSQNNGVKGAASTDDQVRNFEISKTVTTTLARAPRLQRLSVAVLLDGVDGKPRPDAELARLGELVKRAVGFDPLRGDLLDISSAPFGHSAADEAAALVPPSPLLKYLPYAGAALAVLVVGLAFGMSRRRALRRAALAPAPVLTAGARVSEIEAQVASSSTVPRTKGALPAPAPVRPQLVDPNMQVRDRARELAATDPNRAAHLLRAWLAGDTGVEVSKDAS